MGSSESKNQDRYCLYTSGFIRDKNDGDCLNPFTFEKIAFDQFKVKDDSFSVFYVNSVEVRTYLDRYEFRREGDFTSEPGSTADVACTYVSDRIHHRQFNVFYAISKNVFASITMNKRSLQPCWTTFDIDKKVTIDYPAVHTEDGYFLGANDTVHYKNDIVVVPRSRLEMVYKEGKHLELVKAGGQFGEYSNAIFYSDDCIDRAYMIGKKIVVRRHNISAGVVQDIETIALTMDGVKSVYLTEKTLVLMRRGDSPPTKVIRG